MEKKRAGFGSKIGIILATAGSAVGLGNVWRFPYLAGENGGASFILVYVLCVFILGIPCMMNEFVIGRRAKCNTAKAYRTVSKGSPFGMVGYVGVVTGFVITSYYTVVAGWCMHYIFASALNQLKGDNGFYARYFDSFESNPWMPAMWAIVVMLITHYIIQKGVKDGIEKASKMLMPLLFILLLILVVSACLLPGAAGGIEFLFKPDFGKLNSNAILSAMGQAFYSLSIGMGCLCTFASYFSKDTNLMGTAVKISFIDTAVAILAGLIIFPAAFSVGVSPDSGPSLIFITLPNMFNQAFGGIPMLANIISMAFYALLALAAITTLISLHEVSTAFIEEDFHTERKRATLYTTITASVLAVICSLSLADCGEWLKICGVSVFSAFDFVTGQILLPLGGFLTCIYLGWFIPRKTVVDEYTNYGTLRSRFVGVYLFCVRFVCPILIALVFLHQFGVV